MNVADADEYWMCDECFEQFDAALFDVVVENPDLVAEKLGLESDDNG